MRESSTEGQTGVSRKTPGLPTSDGCLADNAIAEAEDDQKNHHVHSMAVLHSVHEDLLVQRHWRLLKPASCLAQPGMTNSDGGTG